MTLTIAATRDLDDDTIFLQPFVHRSIERSGTFGVGSAVGCSS